MKKNTAPAQTIETLSEEYNAIVSKQREAIDDIEKKISECDSTIEKLNAEINKDISTLTPEEYISIQTEIEKAKLTKEMHVKKMAIVKGSFNGFQSAEDKKDFSRRLIATFRAEEEAFVRECDVHLKALDMLLMERNISVNKTLTLGQSIGDYSLMAPSSVRQIVARAISARQNIGSYTN